MPTRKIEEPDCNRNKNICRDAGHNIPNMMYFKPGLYEHVCPKCGQITPFRIREKYMLSASKCAPD